jgi:subtilisin family serine protease
MTPWPAGTFHAEALRPLTGRGVRIAVIDSGVHAGHPHIAQLVTRGIAIGPDGRAGDDWRDRLGHGTAVTAAILEKAPAADVLAVRVFDRELATTVDALAAGIDWAIRERAELINLSLGTDRAAHGPRLAEAVAAAAEAGATIVAAGRDGARVWLPGTLPGAIGVALDWSLSRHEVAIEASGLVRATGYPRPVPGVPVEHNLRGLSFAVANATGVLALLCERLRGALLH